MEKRISLRQVIFWLIILGFSISLVITVLDMQVKLSESERKRDSLQEQVELIEVENKELERRINTDVDEEQLERDAKQYHDYVGENERVFIDMSGS